MTWRSHRRWRAACRHRDRMRPVRDEALSLLQAVEAGLGGWRLTGRTTCLAISKGALGGRLGEIAVRPLVRYLQRDLRTIDLAIAAAKGRDWRGVIVQVGEERRA